MKRGRRTGRIAKSPLTLKKKKLKTPKLQTQKKTFSNGNTGNGNQGDGNRGSFNIGDKNVGSFNRGEKRGEEEEEEEENGEGEKEEKGGERGKAFLSFFLQLTLNTQLPHSNNSIHRQLQPRGLKPGLQPGRELPVWQREQPVPVLKGKEEERKRKKLGFFNFLSSSVLVLSFSCLPLSV